MHISERSIWPKAKPWRRQQTTCREGKASRNTTKVDTRPQESHLLTSVSKGLPLSLNRNPFKACSKLRFSFILVFWPSFPFILVFGPSFSFWPFGPSFPFILAFWAFIFLSFWPFGPFIFFHFGLWGFISFHFGLLTFISLDFGFLSFHFLSFWPFGLAFPFILAFWPCISFHFLLAGAATWGPPHKLPKTVRFLIKF